MKNKNKKRVAILSNITIDLFADILSQKEELYVPAGFDNWQQEIMDQSSGLYKFKPEVVVILLHANAYYNVWNDELYGKTIIDEWCSALELMCSSIKGIPVLVSSIDVYSDTFFLETEIHLGSFFENYMTERIQDVKNKGANIHILPVKETITDLGRVNFYSSKMWYMAAMPYSLEGLNKLAELIEEYIVAIGGMQKKCFALDLDNTLWGGVVGEDGIDGIQLSSNKEGSRYKDTQRILKKMKDNGVLLAILSKNNIEDVEPVFNHEDMLLKHDDFVAEMINWKAKTQSIREIADDLNIGLDSFVFLDDNPIERESMRVECPEVTVLDFPTDSSELPNVVRNAYYKYFLSFDITEEDKNKTTMYIQEKQRKESIDKNGSIEEFLRNMEIEMDIHIMKPEEEKRVYQLIGKTNQFNVTTKRYGLEDIQRMNKSCEYDVITVHIKDRYGSQGLVAVLILNNEKKESENTVSIDSFLMSCRVMSRKIEHEIMYHVKEKLIEQGVRKMEAIYIETKKNSPVKFLFEEMGFSIVSEDISCKKYIINTEQLPDSNVLFRKVSVEL